MKKALIFLKKNIKRIFIIDVVLFYAAVGGMGAFSEPAQVKGLKVSDSTYSSVALDWEDAKDAEGYKVYRSENGKDYEYIESTIDSKFKDKNLTTGKKYSYIVAGRNGFKTSDVSKKNAVRVTPELDTPEVKLDTSKGTVELEISDVAGAIAYEIVRDGKKIAQSEENVYVDEKAQSDTVHKYEVKAVRYKKNPVYSKASKAKKAELHGIQNVEMKADTEDIRITWDSSEYFDAYKVYDGDEELADTAETEYTISDFSTDKIYDIKVLGYSTEDDSQSPTVEKRIKVFEEDMDNEGARQAACDWGVMIANDNSFAYGTGNTAHHCGCYFCGTNRRKKAAGYEKTYCCNPFVHAAYSHGAGDAAMLRTCQKGDSVGMESSDYTRYGTWEKHSKGEELQMGDVLVGGHHVMLYIGDDQVVHAAQEGWDAGSISVDDLASNRRYYDFVMRYTGTGSGTMYKIREVDEKGQPINNEETEGNESEDA